MKRFNLKKVIGVLIIFCMITEIFSGIHIKASEQKTYTGKGFEVTFNIESQWQGAFNGNITVKNTSDKSIEDWVLSFEMPHEITNIWNAVISSHNGNSYVIKNANWNQDIPVGGSISFGFSAKADNQVQIPSSYNMPINESITKQEDYSIDFEINSDWKDGYTANITIKNQSNNTIEDWVLEFDFDSEIQNIWNGVIQSHEGTHYIIKNASYNQNIEAGNTISFGFNGVRTSSEIKPQNYILRERLQSDNTENGDNTNDKNEDESNKDESNEDEEYDWEEEAAPELIDIGEAYFEPIDEKDVLIADDGIMYAKNQLNIVGVEGATYKSIENLGKKYGFEIIGYIELTEDFQVKFNEDKSYEELLEIADELEGYKQIESVYVHTVIISDEDAEKSSDKDTNKKPYYPDTEIWPKSIWSSTPSGINWGMEAIKAPEAWAERKNMSYINIGLIDNEFDTKHEDLKFVKVWNNPEALLDYHGTHVAGTMAATFKGKTGIVGVSVKNHLYAYAKGNINKFIGMMEWKYAFALLIGNNVRVINVSLGYKGYFCMAVSRHNNEALTKIRIDAGILGDFLQRLLINGYDFVITTAAGNENNKNFIKDDKKFYGYREFDSNTDKNSDIVSGNVYAEYGSCLNYISNISELKNVSDKIIVVGSIGLQEGSNPTKYYYTNYSNIGDRVDIVAPGENIYSTIINNEYDKKRGTSMAAPHVAGVAALLYSINPNLSGTQVKSIIKQTAQEINIKDNDNNIYKLVNAAEAIKEAKKKSGALNANKLPTKKGIVYFNVRYEKEDVNIISLELKKIRENPKEPEYLYSEILTSENGQYITLLDEGKYKITITKGDSNSTITNPFIVTREIIAGEGINLGTINLFNGKNIKKLAGKVTDATIDKGVISATIYFRKNFNNTKNEIIDTVKTDENGLYDMELEEGYYTLEVKKDNYITEYINKEVGNDDVNQDIILTPVTNENEYRVVLTWDNKPKDLDLHLTGTNEELNYHIYYDNKNYPKEGTKLANLDRDAKQGYGPETVTFTVGVNGTYRLYVYDFSNWDTKSKVLSNSNAQVKVYKGNALIRTYNVPKNKKGNLWNVFEINNGDIKKIKTLEFTKDCKDLE